MNTMDIIKQLNACGYNNDVAEIDKDTKIKISVSNNLCNIIAYTAIKSKPYMNDIIQTLNEEQSSFRYSIANSILYIKTTMWVDRKPTKVALTEMISLLLASLKATKTLLERGEN